MSRLAKSIIIIMSLVFGAAGVAHLAQPSLLLIVDDLVCKKLGPLACEARSRQFNATDPSTDSSTQSMSDNLLAPPPPPPSRPGEHHLTAPPPPPPASASSSPPVVATPPPVKVEDVKSQLEEEKSEALEAWLTPGHSIDSPLDSDGTTALMVAAQSGSEKLVAKIIQLGANPNTKNSRGDAALHLLSKKSENAERMSPILKTLIAAEADLNIKNELGYTPLVSAVENGNETAVKELLSFRPSLDAQDNNGQTALHHAVRASRADLVAILIQAGASASIKDRKGITALKLAKDTKNKALLKSFASKPALKKENAKENAKVTSKQKAKETAKEKTIGKSENKTETRSPAKNKKHVLKSYPKPNKQ